MSYIVLARKYRPQQFEDLVGQLPVSQTLQNALESGRIAHAYIFSGPRGVGKTTTARLLAKCLNCVKGPTIKPCGECPSCLSIAQGNSVQDVLEIDGASNRGIEQIRELRESAKYAPSSSRYRIYIIDEAHQITKDAFGALLKTLEEPPAHVVFMMATTEVQKIPAPILSRCQRFSLRPVAAPLVLKHLQDICRKEKVKVEEEALADIVRFVEGSLRDALSLLDQAIVFSPEGITSNTLKDLLGLLPREVIRDTAACIGKGDPAEILKLISRSIQSGIDLTQLAKDLQEYYHTLLLLKAGVEDVFQTDLKLLKKEISLYDFPTLERNIRLLSRAQEEMRRSETPRAVFEIFMLKLGQKTIDPKILIERLEKLEKNPSFFTKAPNVSGEKISSYRPEENKASAPSTPPLSPPLTGRGNSNLEKALPSSESSSPREGRGQERGVKPLAAAVQAPQKENQGPGPSTPPLSPPLAGRGTHILGGNDNLGEALPPNDSSSPREGRGQERGFKPLATTVQAPVASADIHGGWANFVNAVAEQKISLAAALEEASLDTRDNQIILTFKKQFNQELVIRSMEVLAPLLMEHFGPEISLETKLGHPSHSSEAKNLVPHPAAVDSRGSSLPPPPIESGPRYEEVGAAEVEDQIQKVLKYFPGTLKKEKKN